MIKNKQIKIKERLTKRNYRVLIIVVVVVMALSVVAYADPVDAFDVALAATEAESMGISGDITGDGSVNISDVQALLKQVNGQSIMAVGNNTNVNEDDAVNISDVQLLLKYVNGQNVAIYGSSTGTVLIDTGNGADTDTADNVTDNTNTDEDKSGNSSSNDTLSAESDSNHVHRWIVDTAGHWETETVVDNDAWEDQIIVYFCAGCQYFNNCFETLDLEEMQAHLSIECNEHSHGLNVYGTKFYIIYHEVETHENRQWIDTTYYCTVCNATATAEEISHDHEWVVYEDGHWETISVISEDAYDEPVTIYVCKWCEFETSDETEITLHEVSNGHSSTTKWGTIYYKAITCEVLQWVDATYYCSVCGAGR